MGRMIKTGYAVPGHGIEFVQDVSSCTMVCECGWVRPLTSFPNPWILQEMNHSVAEHLRASEGEAP